MECEKNMCGDGVFWSFDRDTACVTISGNGKMKNFEDIGELPWRSYLDEIRKVVVGKGVIHVGDRAFFSCGKLTEIILADTVETLGVECFASCVSLAAVTIPEGVKVIGAKAFRLCTALTRVHLPLTLTNIDMRAFGRDAALTTVYYSGTRLQWEQIRISMSASDNRYLVQADICCQGNPPDAAMLCKAPDSRYQEIIDEIKTALRSGGDGYMYIAAPNLTEPGITAKSGDCAIIVFPDGQTMMIDAGYTACSKHVVSLLKDLELGHLDYVVLSHPHDDHSGGLMEVARCIYGQEHGYIGNYYRSSWVEGEIEQMFCQYLREKGVRMFTDVKAKDRWNISGVTIDIFNPEERLLAACTGKVEELNNVSVLMKFTYGSSTYLTGGDLYKNRETELVSVYGDVLLADVVKANHHGTHTSNCEQWLKTVSPAVMIVPADDAGDTFFVQRAAGMGIACYSVGVDGLVMVRMDNGRNYKAVSQYGSLLQKTCGKNENITNSMENIREQEVSDEL